MSNSNEYYDNLLTLPEHWKHYSLRDGSNLTSAITYDPVVGAAKITIPAFAQLQSTVLAANVDAVNIQIPINTVNASLYPAGRVIKIDNEIMTVVSRTSSTSIRVTRATFGSTAASHSSGTIVRHSNNSCRAQSRLALGTADGNNYTFVWDAMWDSSYLGMPFNHKAFQFSSGGPDGDTIWLEPGLRYGSGSCPGQIGNHHTRSYNIPGGPANWADSTGNQLGPGQPDDEIANIGFCVHTGIWTRFIVRIDQLANNYDPVTSWICDENRDPIQVYLNVPVSVRPTGATPNVILKFWLEYNTSDDDFYRLDQRDLTSYFKNFVALRNLSDMTQVLVRPGGVTPQPPDPFIPSRPMNVGMI